MNLALHLKIVGTLLLLLAFAHLFFPKRFGWKTDLAKLTLLNRQVFLVHAFFISLVLVLFGLLSLAYTGTILQPSPLARIVLAGLVMFWVARLFIQFFVYDARLWQGNHFNTTMHVFFSLMWTYYVAVYATALWRQYQP
jgi:hypothetical protein